MKVFVVCWLCIVTLSGVAAPFQNLGFDEANTNNIGGPVGVTYGSIDEMLPGWRLYTIIREETLIGYNATTIGNNYATLYDTNIQVLFPLPIEGKYILGLYPGSLAGVDAPFHLSQIGEVPADAKTLHFIDVGGPFEVRVSGELLRLVYEYPSDYSIPPAGQISPIPIPVVGDISQFSGKTVELEFRTVSTVSRLNAIDSISFSPELIPEPSTWALLGLGGACLLFRWRFLRW